MGFGYSGQNKEMALVVFQRDKMKMKNSVDRKQLARIKHRRSQGYNSHRRERVRGGEGT